MTWDKSAEKSLIRLNGSIIIRKCLPAVLIINKNKVTVNSIEDRNIKSNYYKDFSM